ncbi:NAD(P)-binding protein [Lindgomyces ingoldianus]|uniref:NAD(P)-binding protein n=1 Tax=Lindgomyces ingoldianus TaxID=673940 RepID=A0ACB6R3X1_9PLEO|nr:NAD(P)-binding protein [Lindgomyces ingoldianus]KAF2474019.1 NAD(P)-binding protein [Lindgomyces ingoldianus]
MPSPTVLITGCSDNGIGSALGTVLHERGYHVFAAARNPAKMTWHQSLPNVHPITLDTTQAADVQAALETVTKATSGKLDVLINNAARNHFMPVLDDDLDEVRKLYEVNFIAPLAITQAFAPLLIKAKGMVTFITSISGYVNTPWMGTYAASKRSIEIVAETLRLELKPLGVDVLCAVTGGVKSAGQTYFDDLKLPETSLYKTIEKTIVSRAQGHDGMVRVDTLEYANVVADQIAARTSGKFWYGANADMVKNATTTVAVPQEAFDAQIIQGTGLDVMG